MIYADFSFQKGAALSNAGIVDEDVDIAGLEFIHRSPHTIHVPIQQSDSGPLPGESPADGRTDSTCATGDDDQLIFHALGVHVVSEANRLCSPHKSRKAYPAHSLRFQVSAKKKPEHKPYLIRNRFL
jgi:hypothetical protein